jgi:hypothetical protein
VAEIEGYPVSDGECADNEEFRGSVAIGRELAAWPARRRIQASRSCRNRSSMIAAQDYGLVLLSQKVAVSGIFESIMEANPTETRGLGWVSTER